MNCVFPYIDNAVKSGEITVEEIARIIDEDVSMVVNKLCGNDAFDINEAMTINNELFPRISFEIVFGRKD